MKLKDFTTVDLENATIQIASDFLDKIPPEIRNRIYELSFQSSRVTIGGKEHKGRSKAPGILLACKQIYGEGIKVYWSKSSFSFREDGRLKPCGWLGNIRRRRRELLSEVFLETSHLTFNAGWHNAEQWNKYRVQSARGMLSRCYGEQRGVRQGVLKVNLQLVDPRENNKPLEICTSNPEATMASFLKDVGGDGDEETDE